MKTKFNYLLALFSLVAFLSCGKYGYDFQDGRQAGEQTGEDVDPTDMDYIDKSLYHRARIFPGMVAAEEPRLTDVVVPLNLDFFWVKASELKVSHTPRPIFSTGLYAPAGENIKIVVPEHIVGLTAQIGAHMDDLTGIASLRRDPVIYTVKELKAGDNYIRNPYGGLLWINSDLAYPNKNDFKITVTGAVKSPDYIQGVTTDQEAWLRQVEASTVPWIELRSEGVIFTVSRNLVLQNRTTLDINYALDFWQESFKEDFFKWVGLSEDAQDPKKRIPTIPERAVLDIQPVLGYAHSGFPFVAQADSYWFRGFADKEFLEKTFSHVLNVGAWGTFHEVGHNYQSSIWSWSDLVETSNNLFVFKAADRLKVPFRIDLDFNLLHSFQQGVQCTNDTTSIKSFSAPLAWVDAGKFPFFRLGPFLQIFNRAVGRAEGYEGKDGWSFMPYLYNKARDLNTPLHLDQAKIDFFYRTLCDYTRQDYYRFFERWGIPVSIGARRIMANQYPALDMNVWDYNIVSKTGGNINVGAKYNLRHSKALMSFSTNSSTSPTNFESLMDYNMASSGVTMTAPVGQLTSITIDMKTMEAFRGVYYSNVSNKAVKSLNIYVSDDLTNFKLVKQATGLSLLANTRLEVDLDKVYTGRYVKVELVDNEVSGSRELAFGELGLYFKSLIN